MAPRGERRHLQTPPQKGASQELAPILGGKSSGPAQLSFGASTAVGEGAALDELRSARSGAAWVLDKTLREKEEAKWEALVASASGKAPPKVAACLNRCAPAVAWAAVGCEVCVPVYRTITTGGWFAGEALQFGGTGPWRKLLLYRE